MTFVQRRGTVLIVGNVVSVPCRWVCENAATTVIPVEGILCEQKKQLVFVLTEMATHLCVVR